MTAAVTTLVDGRYRLTEQVAGTDPTWWWARDERLRRDVVVRIFDTDVAATPGNRALLAELANLTNPGLVGVLDAGDDLTIGEGDARVYLVHEPVFAPSLAALIMTDDGVDRVDVATVAAIGASVAATLAYLHGQGMTHGAISPRTALVLPDDPFGSTPPPRRVTKLLDCAVGRLRGARPAAPEADLRALGDLLWTSLPRDTSLDDATLRESLRDLALDLRCSIRPLDAAQACGELAGLTATATVPQVRTAHGRHRTSRRRPVSS